MSNHAPVLKIAVDADLWDPVNKDAARGHFSRSGGNDLQQLLGWMSLSRILRI